MYTAGEVMDSFLHTISKKFAGFASRVKFITYNIINKWFNRNELFTLMVVPHAPVKSVKSVKFSRWIISLFVILNILMFSAACVFLFSYHNLNNKLQDKKSEYDSLQVVKDSAEEKLKEYKANEKEISDRLQFLKELESKLKDIIESRSNGPLSTESRFPRLASRGSSMNSSRFYVVNTNLQDFSSLQDMYNAIDKTAMQIEGDIKELNNSNFRAEFHDRAMKGIPSVLPTYGQITSDYGYRQNPFGSGYEFHAAIDIANSPGTAIRASGDGLVIHAGWETGYGILAMIDHQNGYESLYGHNSRLSVEVGQKVKRGEIIAYMGDTGRSTGTHCHYEVRLNGKPVNPYIENK